MIIRDQGKVDNLCKIIVFTLLTHWKYDNYPVIFVIRVNVIPSNLKPDSPLSYAKTDRMTFN